MIMGTLGARHEIFESAVLNAKDIIMLHYIMVAPVVINSSGAEICTYCWRLETNLLALWLLAN